MSAIVDLENSLQSYWQMQHHRDAALMSCLQAVQAWQKARMKQTHETLFAEPNHTKIADYFLNRLYGGDDFEVLARQLERIIPNAKRIEKIVPNTSLETGNAGISLAILAIKLDEDVASYLLTNQLDVTEENMIKAYHACDQKTDREKQMRLLSELCYRLDKYVRSFMLKKAFDLTKSAAYNYRFNALYDFIGEGFDAMKPIKSMKAFIEPFCADELTIVEQVHSHKPQPFTIKR